MKIVQIGNRFEIYDDTMKVHNQLPPDNYIIRFNKMTGFYLEKYFELSTKEEKIYGVHEKKVTKVLNSFERTNRNLGVILSGDKGIGKSLFAKLLSIKAVEKGIPLIIVDKFYPGIASYIEEIDQEVVVLFDEFDKTFAGVKTDNNETDPQAGLLTLFDGISQGKKLFVITCNDMHKLNDFLINRPGRFLYNIRFEYPSVAEIREYLLDKLGEAYLPEIEKVIQFSKKVSLNYDCLRAIAFELESGEPFEEAIKDMNITNTEAQYYDIFLKYKEGLVLKMKNITLDMFDNENCESLWLVDNNDRDYVKVSFYPCDAVFSPHTNEYLVPLDKVTFDYDNDYKELVEAAKNMNPECLAIRLHKKKSIHYAV